MKKDIRAYGYDRLKEEMEALGEKPFLAKQVYEWLHVKLADDFDEMTNLSKALREKLKEEYVILPVKMLERQISQIDGTNKFLFQSTRTVADYYVIHFRASAEFSFESSFCFFNEVIIQLILNKVDRTTTEATTHYA